MSFIGSQLQSNGSNRWASPGYGTVLALRRAQGRNRPRLVGVYPLTD
jgi:hypothetical protein